MLYAYDVGPCVLDSTMLHPHDVDPTEEPEGSHEQRRDEHEIRGDVAEPAAEPWIDVPGRKAFEDADEDGPRDRPGNAVEPPDDHDGEDLEPQQHDPEASAAHDGPQGASDDGDAADHRPRDREVAMQIDAHRHGDLLIVRDGAKGHARTARMEEP